MANYKPDSREYGKASWPSDQWPEFRIENLVVKDTERVSYGYIDTRTMWSGSPVNEAKFDPFYEFWTLKNMAQVCCGLEGPTEKIDRPDNVSRETIRQ